MSVANHVSLTGNLGNDPETKYSQGGTAITKISLATTDKRRDRDGNTQDRTEWHRVKFFGKLAEIAGEYLRKGSKVQVIGSIRYDKYTGQDGVEKYTTEIIADQMLILSSRQDGEQRPAQRGTRPQESRGTSNPAPPPMDDFADDDIHF